MLGRGLVSRPDLALQIAAARDGREYQPMSWEALLPLLREFWRQAQAKLSPRYAPGRMKQWLAMLTRSYPEAVLLFAELRREDDCQRISRLLGVEVQAFEECVA
ncbi:tRNA-dihydrouridine synthase C [compost metagenome]